MTVFSSRVTHGGLGSALLTDPRTPPLISRKESISHPEVWQSTVQPCQLGSRAPPTFILHKLASILSCSTILRACPMLIVLFTGVSPFILEKRDSSEHDGGPCTVSAEGPPLISLYEAGHMLPYFTSLLSPTSSGLSHPCLPKLRKWRGGMRSSPNSYMAWASDH